MTTKTLIATLLVIYVGTNAKIRDPKWAKKLNEVLQVRDSYIGKLENLAKVTTAKNVEEFIAVMEKVSSRLTGVDNLNLAGVEKDRAMLKQLIDQPEEPKVTKFFRSKNLSTSYAERGLGFILRTLRAHYDYQCIKILLSPPQSKPADGPIPINIMCSRVKEDLGKQNRHIFSTDKICKNVKQCAGAKTPHPYGDSSGTSAKDACKPDNGCDVAKALPMMGALLWYKISNFIAQSFCSNSLTRPGLKSALKTDLKEIDKMADLIMAYASTFYWKGFFREAVQKRAYSNLANAMSIVKKREKSMGFVSLACIELKAKELCNVGSIYKFFVSLKKIQKDRRNPEPTRNLRFLAKINHAKMIELKKNALKHIALLGTIRNLNDNLRTAVAGIAKYFRGLAKYDQGIAQADVNFISKKLKQFDTQATTLSKKVESDIKGVLKALITAQTLQVVEESTILGLKIAEHLNPMKVIFGGVEAGDIYEQTAEVARSLQELARGSALMANLKRVYEDTSALAKNFSDNAAQIANLTGMVNATKKNKIDQIGYDADKFIKSFDGYTPKVDKARLAKNDALLAAFKESACSLLFGAQGSSVSVVQGVAGGMLLCENLQGTLAEFAALRGNIFDFQFNLVNALARVVRGNVAKKLAESITVSNDLLDASQLMLGFFMTQYRLQSHAALYCDKLEYLNQGRKVDICSTPGFFKEDDLDNLVAYNPDTTYDLDERFVYIPTRPQFSGDTGFINLPSLAKGNPVTFRLPAKRTWLRKYNWLARREILAPFVESFKLYLPLKEYKTGREKQYSRTRIQLTSVAGSSFSENSDVVYSLPFEHSNYLTKYTEGYNRCPNGKEITNPYSLCNNLPKICDTNTRVPPLTKSIMPTILSTWKLSYTVESGESNLPWNAPDPATDLLIVGKVKLRFLSAQPSRRRILWHRKDEAAVGCCTGNKYRPEWKVKTCVPCPSKPPTDSVSNLRGYYCEKGSEPVTSKIPKSTKDT